MILYGTTHRVGDDITTDAIIAPEWRDAGDPAVLAAHCLASADPSIAELAREGDLLLAGRGFGAGAEQDLAALALQAASLRRDRLCHSRPWICRCGRRLWLAGADLPCRCRGDKCQRDRAARPGARAHRGSRQRRRLRCATQPTRGRGCDPPRAAADAHAAGGRGRRLRWLGPGRPPTTDHRPPKTATNKSAIEHGCGIMVLHR